MAKGKPTDGLYLRKDGVYEKSAYVKGKRIMFRSTDPDEVWRKYYTSQEEIAKGKLFPEAADAWFAEHSITWRSGTLASYKASYVRCKERFSEKRVTEIEASDIYAFLLYLKGMNMSRKTVLKHLSVMRMIFNHVIMQPDSPRRDNPTQFVSLPVNLPRSKRTPPTEEQMALVKAGFDNPDGLLAAFFVYSGARLGEALAIQGRHLRKNKIIIDQEVVWASNRPEVMPYTKTEAGERNIGVMKQLKKLLPKQLGPDEFLFGGESPWTKSMYVKRWASWCASVGLAHKEEYVEHYKGKEFVRTRWKADITPHQLRHEYASRCFEAGVDEMVTAQLMGHTTSQMTRSIYQHVRPRQVDDATAKLDALEAKATQ